MAIEHPALAGSRQLVLVVSENWDATDAKLHRFERQEQGWSLVDRADVTLGRTGLAWGRGLLQEPLSPGPAKREGDGKAPAGIFDLGVAFGSATAAENGVQTYPYLQVTSDHLGIDDPKSTHYNSIVNQTQVGHPDWQSHEVMLRPDGLYRLGLVVKHNWNPGRQPEAHGSCIFMHIWKAPGVPTAGCTAMDAGEMGALLKWLDAAKQPRLVQLTKPDYLKARELWSLPQTASRSGDDALTASILSVFALVGILGIVVYRWFRPALAKRM